METYKSAEPNTIRYFPSAISFNSALGRPCLTALQRFPDQSSLLLYLLSHDAVLSGETIAIVGSVDELLSALLEKLAFTFRNS